jgi:hypothetical protein
MVNRTFFSVAVCLHSFVRLPDWEERINVCILLKRQSHGFYSFLINHLILEASTCGRPAASLLSWPTLADHFSLAAMWMIRSKGIRFFPPEVTRNVTVVSRLKENHA